MVWRLAYVMLASSQQGTQYPPVPTRILLPLWADNGNRHSKRDHELIKCSTVPLSFCTRTYMVDSIHFLVFVARVNGPSLLLLVHVQLVQPGVLWLGVTGM